MQQGNETAAWELLEETFNLFEMHPLVPLKDSCFSIIECVNALEYLPHYADFRRRFPISNYWEPSIIHDASLIPPISKHINGTLTNFLAIPFGLGMDHLEKISGHRDNIEVLVDFFEALRSHVESSVVISGRQLACLIPPKEHGPKAVADVVSQIITFLGGVALHEFALQRGWILSQFAISPQVLNCDLDTFDEMEIYRNVICNSLLILNEETHFAPDGS